MLKNYLKIAFRNLRRHKAYSFINIIGLAVGLACCLLILLYVKDELAYDRFHNKADRIYRLVSDTKSPEGRIDKFAATGWPYGRLLEAEYPETEAVVYLRSYPTFSIRHKNRYYYEKVVWADSTFFDVFSFPLLKGNPQTALREPFTLVLTEAMAQKYFGQEEALGQTLMLNDSLRFTVTGVVVVPRQSHIQFDVLVSLSTYCAFNPQLCTDWFATGWFNINMINYVLLRDGVDGAAFAVKLENFVQRHAGEAFKQAGFSTTLRLQPLADIYLRSDRNNFLGPSGSIATVYLLSAIALFVVLIACVNFMNLATARSTQRAKEVGVRKVVGSSRGLLMQQFLSESFLTCLLALALALEIISLVLPFFNELIGKSLTMNELAAWPMTSLLFGVVVIVSLLAGLYPAFVLTGFRPVEVLKGPHAKGQRVTRIRQALVVFQFAISCILIVSTVVVFKQLRFMQSQDLGFDKEQVLVLDARQASAPIRIQRYESIKQELMKHSSARSATAAYALPGRNGWRGQFAFPEGRPQNEGLSLEYIAVDHDFVKTLGLKLVAGRDFSTTFTKDAELGVLINEAAVQAIGWETPENALGKHLASPGSGKGEGVVVGVVKDYHHHGLREKIEPIMYGITPYAFAYFALRFDTSDLGSVLSHAGHVWSTFFPGYAFNYFFLDEDYDRQYRAEQRLTKVFGIFSSLFIIIACLGLFGLAAFSATIRTKEIGIRKVLGASVAGIAGLLSKEFVKLVLVANLIAWPIAYFAMNRWLQDFAYRIDIGWWVFALAGGLALFIALLTVSTQAIKAALANPVEALRYE